MAALAIVILCQFGAGNLRFENGRIVL